MTFSGWVMRRGSEDIVGEAEDSLRAGISHRSVVIILLGMFLLVFPLRLFAQAFPLKAIYYAGNGYAFTDLNAGSYTMLIEQAANANGVLVRCARQLLR